MIHPLVARRYDKGFSLIELAIVLVVIGLLLGGGIVALEVTTERRQRGEQGDQLEAIRDALYGFAISEGRLPCPADIDAPDGEERFNGAGDACAATRGALPWVELGMGRRDAWSHRLLYRVNPAFADPSGEDVVFTLDTQAEYDADDDATIGINDLDGNRVAKRVVATVVSFGGQGDQVWIDGDFDCPGTAAGFSTAESTNCDASGLFVAGGYRSADTADGRFDDLVIWLPEVVLKARMVEAGRLP